MITFPNAKINLGLHVTEKRPDSYHNIETVFYPIPLQDALEVSLSQQTESPYSFYQRGAAIEESPDENSVVKAWQLIKEDYPHIPAVHIHLFKHIPCGAGLGGGSSDAAFMIKMLNERFSLNISTEKMEEYAARIGADCAFFIQNQPALATGVGNIFEPIAVSLKDYFLVLVKPEDTVSTREAYTAITPRKSEIPLKEAIGQPVEAWKELLTNDFEQLVFPRHPHILAIKDKLYDMGAIYASMSGSGSSVYGLFKEQIPFVDEKFVGCFCRQRELLI